MRLGIDMERTGEHDRHTPEKRRCVLFIMKIITKKKCRTVSASSPAEFDREFDKASTEIGEEVDLEWEKGMPLTVHLIYTVQEQVAETLSEELALRGEHYYCKDCPYSEKAENGRSGIKGCTKGMPGVVDYTPACELYLRDILQGKVRR